MLQKRGDMSTDEVSQADRNDDESERDEEVDEVDEESFPASDPPSSWAGSNPDSGD
jgi:hypothetical protein